MTDTISYINSNVATVGFGGCIGMAAFLLAMGQKSKRCVLRNTCIMIYHPVAVARGQAVSIFREAHELLRFRNEIDRLISVQSEQPINKVAFDLRRKLYMTSEDASLYGIIDHIVRPIKKRLINLSLKSSNNC